MPPKRSTRQNSVANSHAEAESQGHSHAMGETHAQVVDRHKEEKTPSVGDKLMVANKSLAVEKSLLVDHNK